MKALEILSRWRRPFPHLEVMPLLLLVLLAGGVWSFAALAGEVAEGETRQLDERILLALREPADRADPLGPRWAEEAGRDFTALGSVPLLALLTLSVSAFLALAGQPRAALLVLLAVGGGQLLSLALKHGFDRPRPDLVPHGAYVMSTSFPSAHSAMAAATYLTLGALLARVQPRKRLKAFLLGLAVLLTLLVGASRVYLGVHWPTDVLAGWAAGATWALLCWLVAWWVLRRGEAGDPSPGAEPRARRPPPGRRR